MTFKLEKKDGVNVVTLSGRLDTEKAEMMEKDFDQLIETGIDRTIVVMTDVNYMSSSMIRVLLKTLKRHAATDGSFWLAEPQPSIVKILTITGLEKLFNIQDNKEEAFKAMNDLES